MMCALAFVPVDYIEEVFDLFKEQEELHEVFRVKVVLYFENHTLEKLEDIRESQPKQEIKIEFECKDVKPNLLEHNLIKIEKKATAKEEFLGETIQINDTHTGCQIRGKNAKIDALVVLSTWIPPIIQMNRCSSGKCSPAFCESTHNDFASQRHAALISTAIAALFISASISA
ncbi:hypothetical protein TKK_0001315 [Trichogramma kaykai]